MADPKPAGATIRPPVIRATPEELEAHRAALAVYTKFAKLKPGPRPWDSLEPE